MIKYINGDLLKGKDDVIVHGCNCLCNFGAGIALYISEIYPEAYMVDKQTKYKDKNKLGTYSIWTGENKFFPSQQITIVNAYTQFFPNYKMKPFDYEAFAKILIQLKKEFNDKTIGFPKIGAGLAGGNWNTIETMINETFTDKNVNVYIFK